MRDQFINNIGLILSIVTLAWLVLVAVGIFSAKNTAAEWRTTIVDAEQSWQEPSFWLPLSLMLCPGVVLVIVYMSYLFVRK